MARKAIREDNPMFDDATSHGLERRAHEAGREAEDRLDAVAAEYWTQMDQYRRLQAGERGVPIPTNQEEAEGVGRITMKVGRR